MPGDELKILTAADGIEGIRQLEPHRSSLPVCTLEVYYRHAPIFRRIVLD
jgi:hypothetical protein